MSGALQIKIYDQQRKVYEGVFDEAVELGRQRDASERLHSAKLGDGRNRLVVASLDEDTVSREHALIKCLGPDRIRLTNLSAKVVIRLQDGAVLLAGESVELTLPTVIALGRKTIRIEASLRESEPAWQSLFCPHFRLEVVGWLAAIGEVLRHATDSSEFYRKVARCLVDVVGMEQVWVLLWEDGEWGCLANWFCRVDQARSVLPSPDRETLRQLLQESPAAPVVKGVVAAVPVVCPGGEFVGALYCSAPNDLTASELGQMQLTLLELLARAVALDLAFVGDRKVLPLAWKDDGPDGDERLPPRESGPTVRCNAEDFKFNEPGQP